MTNEPFIRNAYHVAEIKGIPLGVACFTPDGTFTDESLGVTYRGRNELGRTVEVDAKAFPDMHRELYDVVVHGDVVIVELSLNDTHKPVGAAERSRSPFRKKNEGAVLRCISSQGWQNSILSLLSHCYRFILAC